MEYDSLIEFVLRNATTIKKCVEQKRMETENGNGHTGGGTSNHSYISDPTALQAIRRVDPIGYIHCPFGAAINGTRDTKYIRLPEKWLKVEKLTREFYTKDGQDENVREIYKRRYLSGEYGEKQEITCAKLSISKGFYYAVVHDVIHFAGLYAAGYGIISPYSRF